MQYKTVTFHLVNGVAYSAMLNHDTLCDIQYAIRKGKKSVIICADNGDTFEMFPGNVVSIEVTANDNVS